MEDILKRLERIEYHQKLLTKMINDPKNALTKLIILNDLSSQEVEDFYQLCEMMSKKLEEQKAEGFVYFHPLLEEFKAKLTKKLNIDEVVQACLKQNLFSELMSEFAKLL